MVKTSVGSSRWSRAAYRLNVKTAKRSDVHAQEKTQNASSSFMMASCRISCLRTSSTCRVQRETVTDRLDGLVRRCWSSAQGDLAAGRCGAATRPTLADAQRQA